MLKLRVPPGVTPWATKLPAALSHSLIVAFRNEKRAKRQTQKINALINNKLITRGNNKMWHK